MLDEKVSRLSPEEQRMVDEFVDFLLSRHGQFQPDIPSMPPLTGYHEKVPAKPIITAEETHINRERDILPDYKDLGGDITSEPAAEQVHEEPTRVRIQKVPTNRLLDWID
jgi:hypothetical protein